MLRPALLALALTPALCAATAQPAQAQNADSPSAEEAIKRKLAATKVSLDFRDTPLDQVTAFLAKTTGCNFVIGREARDQLAGDEVRINLVLQEVPADSVLNLLCDMVQLRWRVQRGVVLIAGEDAPLGPTEIRHYDLRDLTVAPRDHRAPFRDLFNALHDRNGGEDWAEPDGLVPEGLVELIQSTVEPESWDLPDASITQIGGTLMVRTTAENHTAIAGLLTDLRAIRNLRVAVEITVVDTAASVARDLRAAMTEAPALSPRGDEVLAAAYASGAATLLSRSTISGYNAQQVAVRDGTQVRIDLPTGSPTPQAVLHDGLTAEIRPVLIGGAGTVRLRARLQYTGDRTRAGGSLGMAAVTIDTALSGPLGAQLLVGGGSSGAADGTEAPARETLVFMRVTSPGEPAIPVRYGAGSKDEAKANALRAKLQAQTVTCEFDGTPLLEVASFLSTQTKVNLVVDESVFEERAEDELLVNLRVADLTAWDVLHLAAQLTRTRLVTKADYVRFTVYPSESDTAIAVYDLRDLVQPSVFAPPHNPDLTAAPGDPGPRRDDQWEPMTTDVFADLIREAVNPESWDTPPNSLEARPGFLIARNAPAVLAEVDALVQRLRAAEHRPLLVEAFFVDTSEPAWKANGFGRVLTPAQADTLAKAAGGGQKDVRLVAAGRVTGFNAQRFSLHAGRQLATFDKEGPLFAADGVVLDIRPVLSGDRTQVHCEVDIRRRQAGATGVLRPGLPAQELRTHVKIPAGGAVALGAFAVPGKPGSLLVLRVTPANKK